MQPYKGTDIYCDLIIPGHLSVRVVHETSNVLAFYHTKPHWPVHIVVVPKHHVASVLSLTDEPELTTELLDVIRVVSQQVVNEHGAARVLTNLGEYQDSKHLHFHVSSGAPLETHR